MFIIDILFAAVIGLILTLLFGFGFGRKGPWSNILIFFLIVFLASWAIGNLANEYGPNILGFYFFPYFAAALVIALLLAAATPLRLYHHRKKNIEMGQEEETAEEPSTFDMVFDGFFWAFITALLLLIILGYAMHFSAAG